jgi:hypothetical protein
MEKEIMRLQEVLKEREAEISALEANLKEKEHAEQSPIVNETPKPSEVEDLAMHLSPTTMQKFNAVCKSMEIHHGVSSVADSASADVDADVDESLDRLNELML